MDEFKMWHDDDKVTFHAEKMVFFSQCDSSGFLSLHELLRLTSDIAVEDYRQQGLSREFLKEKGFAILVSRVSFRIHQMPRENQRISISTWEEVPEALQLFRAYEITGENGEKLVSGYSSWLLADPVARRIIPTKRFTLHEPTGIKKEHDCLAPGKIVLPENLSKTGSRIIGFSDLDSNGHTNNSRYGAFILDALPPEYAGRRITDFRLNYSKEAMLGQELELFSDAGSDANKVTLVGKTAGATSFESELFFA